jgi:hypothetical protein
VDEVAALNALVVDTLWAETTDDPSKKESTVKRVSRQVREEAIVRSKHKYSVASCYSDGPQLKGLWGGNDDKGKADKERCFFLFHK